MAQTEEFMFQNVGHRPTVYKTGAEVKLGVQFACDILSSEGCESDSFFRKFTAKFHEFLIPNSEFSKLFDAAWFELVRFIQNKSFFVWRKDKSTG
jgi:hypothetical protein